jgi:hypothetical protein
VSVAAARTPDQWLGFLVDKVSTQRNRITKWDQYYEGSQPLSYLAPELVVEMGDRLRPVIINWPRLVVDSIEEREDVEGFRLSKEEDADDELWRVWQANDLDEESQRAHVDALVFGRSYVIVGTNEAEPDTPLITVESPMDVYVELDPRTRLAAAGVKLWSEDPPTGAPLEHATLYLPDVTTWYVKQSGTWTVDEDYPADEHGLGQVPVVPLLNRGRIRNRLGVSELADVTPLSDAACKIATDMLVSAEFHAMPRRYAIGMAPQDFVDVQGNPLSTWSVVAGRLWATDKTTQDGVSLGQFNEANLTNFHETINCLARLVASMAGLDPSSLGFTTAAPASADAIRANEARLIKRVKRKMRTLGGGWEQVMRLADRFASGAWRPELRSMETLWANPETPTVAQSADAAVKLYNLPTPIVPLRQTRETLGFTQTQIDRMEQEDAAQQQKDLAMFKMETAAQTTAPDTGVPADNNTPAVPAAA